MKSAVKRAKARRELGLAVGLCLLGAALLLTAAGRNWATGVLDRPPLPPTTVTVDGSDAAPLVRAVGLVGLAAVVALAATRRTGRRAVGALLLVAGLLVLPQLAQAGERAGRVAAQRSGLSGQSPDLDGTGWRLVAAAGALSVIAAGGLAAARAGRWAELSSRYDAPASGPRQREQDPAVRAWDALDRGEDPTA